MKKSLKTEAENPYRLFETGSRQTSVVSPEITEPLPLSPLSTDYEPGEMYTVSDGRFLIVNRSAALTAVASWGVSDTSRKRYDVWATFIPPAVVEGAEPLPSSISATINYAVYRGTTVTVQRILTEEFELDPVAVTRIKLAELPELEISYEGLLQPDEYLYSDPDNKNATDYLGEKYGVKVQIKNTASILDATKDRNLYVDCIELIPRSSE